MTFPDSQGQVQIAVDQGREGMQRQGRSRQNTTVQPWGGALVPPRGNQFTDTRLWCSKVQCLLQGAKKGEWAPNIQKTQNP